MAVALFVSVPANPDLRDLSNARFAQDDSRDPHTAASRRPTQIPATPKRPGSLRTTRVIRTLPASRMPEWTYPVCTGRQRDPHTTRFTYTNSDARDPANARFAQDDNRDPHNSRFVVGVVVERTPG